MNGALYISFFQGQLESALEQVVQLAVQEITKTVGASLNLMLLDAATKDKENQRLRSKLQSRKNECAAKGKASDECEGTGDTNAGNEGTKPEQHTPSRSTTDGGMQTDSLRLEQKRRAVGQLKVVMEQVLQFAVCELTRIVEDGFDDVLLELGKTEREQLELLEQLQDVAEEHRVLPEEAREQEGRPDSAGGSEPARQESRRVLDRTPSRDRSKEQAGDPNDSDKQTVITVTQDWVPILDKVFGQKWCTDLWQIKELSGSKEERAGLGAGLGAGPVPDVDSLIRESLASASQKSMEARADQGQWLQAHDMEVLSPTSEPQCTSVTSSIGDELRSPSMLHRLLTLPSQLLEGDSESADGLASLAEPEEPHNAASPAAAALAESTRPLPRGKPADEDGEEEDEGEPKALGAYSDESSRSKGGRKGHACKECGRKFGRAHQLKAHRQTHREAGTCCPQCGKSFSKQAKLQSHLRTHSGKTT